jgi:hypothetical protein
MRTLQLISWCTLIFFLFNPVCKLRWLAWAKGFSCSNRFFPRESLAELWGCLSNGNGIIFPVYFLFWLSHTKNKSAPPHADLKSDEKRTDCDIVGLTLVPVLVATRLRCLLRIESVG